MKKIILLLFVALNAVSCAKTAKPVVSQEEVKVNVPAFVADSAYAYVKKQVDFGARVPNTKAHKACARYLAEELKRFGAKVVEQTTVLKGYDGKELNCVNIIGAFNPDAQTRVLLLSHWDSRPWADNDPDPKNHDKPVMAANDGASGVGVLLEMARQLGKQKPGIGVDILFVDAEDYGESGGNNEDSWCLGTQYWAKTPHEPGYTARYGILLDMVGAPEAVFYREQVSEYYATGVVDKVWQQAQSLGFGQYFRNEKGGTITDDHVYINKLAKIPCVDIIHFDPNSPSGFGTYWHTIHDTMDKVDKNTLHAVGTTLMHVIYNEK